MTIVGSEVTAERVGVDGIVLSGIRRSRQEFRCLTSSLLELLAVNERLVDVFRIPFGGLTDFQLRVVVCCGGLIAKVGVLSDASSKKYLYQRSGNEGSRFW